MKKPSAIKLSKADKEDILKYMEYEVLPHIWDSCIPPMKDVSVKGDKFSDIWGQRQEVLYKQALEVVKNFLEKIKN